MAKPSKPMWPPVQCRTKTAAEPWERLEVAASAKRNGTIWHERRRVTLDKRAEADGIRKSRSAAEDQEQWGRSAAGRNPTPRRCFGGEILDEVSAEIDEIVKGRGARDVLGAVAASAAVKDRFAGGVGLTTAAPASRFPSACQNLRRIPIAAPALNRAILIPVRSSTPESSGLIDLPLQLRLMREDASSDGIEF